MRLSGILGPVTTTFTPDEALDLAGFAANLRAHIAQGLHGVVVCGSNGEGALVDDAERSRLLEAARAAVPRDHLLLMGTGAESTHQCVARCRDAAARGADAVLVVAPHYYGAQMTPEAIRAHFERVADESPVPVIMYNIPKYMHFRYEPDLVAELSQHRNIIGIKDSSGDLDLLKGYLQSQGDAFSVLTGSGGQLLQGLQAGAHGAIVGVGLFAAGLCLDVWDGFRSGDLARATAAQEKLKPMAAQIVGGLGPAGVKAAQDAVGLVGGLPRMPLRPLSNDQRALVRQLMA